MELVVKRGIVVRDPFSLQPDLGGLDMPAHGGSCHSVNACYTHLYSSWSVSWVMNKFFCMMNWHSYEARRISH